MLPKIKKAPAGKKEWPSVAVINNADVPTNSTDEWMFRFEATYGKDAGPLMDGRKFDHQWIIKGRRRDQEQYVKAEFMARAEMAGIRFIYMYEQVAPPTAEQKQFIDQFNEQLVAERRAKEQAA